MASFSVCVLLLASLGVALTTATRINGVCNSVPSAKGIARPEISNVFRVDVECAMQEQNRSIFVREYFDYDNNRGRITQRDTNTQGDAFFDYNDNEVILVDTLYNQCLVGKLSTSDDRWMFGYKPDPKAQGRYHIFGASGALHFGDSPEEYMGKTKVRGIVVDQWNSCQYSDSLNATMKVSWYFSAKTAWDMQLGAETAPIRATAVGKQYKNGLIVPFNHTYDLYNYQKSIKTEDFEIPVGIVCPGRVKSKPFPDIPNRFSMIVEVLDSNNGVVTYLEENYDAQALINVFRYKRAQDMGSLMAVDRMLQVNDFNSGVSYVIDTSQDSCQITQVGNTGISFVTKLSNGKVIMKDPAQFFAETSSSMYTYAGVRTTRDIPCELWVARTDKINGYTDRNLTVEWYFALSNDHESWNALGSQWRLPIQFRMWDKGESDSIFEANVFYYDTVRPSLINTDISPCFHGSERRRFAFDVDGSAQKAVYNNIEMFKDALASAVALHAGISKLRVADIEVYSDATAIHVSFDLLDKPRLAGDSANMTAENDLTNAVRLYNFAMNGGTLTLPVVLGDKVQTISPVPDSSAEVGGSSGSFTTGALAGLGIALLVAGSAGGAVGAFFFFK